MLDLHIDLVVITFVSFIFLIFVLNKLLYIPLLDFMDSRDDSIQNDIAVASKNINAIDDSESEIKSNLEEARKEADSLKQQAILGAQKEQDSQIQALREELDAKYLEFTNGLEKEKEVFRSDIISKLPILKKDFNKKLSTI